MSMTGYVTRTPRTTSPALAAERQPRRGDWDTGYVVARNDADGEHPDALRLVVTELLGPSCSEWGVGNAHDLVDDDTRDGLGTWRVVGVVDRTAGRVTGHVPARPLLTWRLR